MNHQSKPEERIDLRSFFFDSFDKSDLQKTSRHNRIPHKCKKDGKEFYYYNADLSGLMWIPGNDRKLKYNDFIDFYRNGFADGLKHLKSQEGIRRKDFYNTNKIEELKRVLHSFLYIRDFMPNHKGLMDLKNKIPLIWTEKRIYKEGYYNGLLHSIITLCNELNIDVFEEEKEEELGKPEIEKKITVDELLKKQNILIPAILIEDVYNHFKFFTIQTNKDDEFYLTPNQLNTFIFSTFVKDDPIQQKFNCSFIKKDLRKVFYRFYEIGKNKENGNKTKLKQKYFDIMNKGFEGFNTVDYKEFHK